MFRSLALLGGLALFSSAAAGAVWHVNVSDQNANLLYSPSFITNVSIGDKVVYTFNPKNHTVTQSSFQQPCTHLDGGFDSGFNPTAPNNAYPPTFTVTVNDTKPIWVYCKQAANTPQSHCGNGMVHAINPGLPGTNNSFGLFFEEALYVGQSLSAAASPTPTSTPPSWSSPTTTPY
ncbi:hypothetical protein EI94DRAFT_1720546 [Lactarius quietus]|nr:hypothetical protein EI94DRAFT_1720546 [Lactarius quietus]